MRIWSWAGAVDPENNTTNFTVNVYTPSGQKLGAYLLAPAFVQNSQTQFLVVPSVQVTLSSSDTYFGSRRLAVMDQLGSTSTFYPWGEAKGTNPQNTWNFATYWQDSTTGLDYANNRYYSNIGGRFMTPDPYMAGGAQKGSVNNPADPGSWNRYAYTRGDPVNRADPAGTCDLQISFSGDDAFYTNCDPSLGLDFNPSAYAQCMATPGCMSGGGGGGAAEAGTIYAQGGSIPTSVTNPQHLNPPMFGNLASALANTDCGNWFQAGLATSGVGGPGQSLASFLTNTLPTVTGSANFVGGNANGIEDAGYLAPGYSILFNNAGAFFNPLQAGQSIAFSTQYVSQYASINGGSPQAQAFLLLHEIAHALGMFLPDANSNANQAINNDDLWRNCGSVIQSFSNKRPSQ
jgi:RHS repeat-associated protein